MTDASAGDGPRLDAAAAALLDTVLRETGPGATAYDIMVALVASRDPLIVPILPMDPSDLDQAPERFAEGRADPAARTLLETPASELGDAACAQARYLGSPAATLRHLVLAVFALVPSSGILPHLRRMVADLELTERLDPDTPRGWVAHAPPDGARMATPEEIEALGEEMRRLRAEDGLPEFVDLMEEGDLRGVVAIGTVARRDPVRLQVTALEIRTTHAILGWRLWIEGREDVDPLPMIEVSDDRGTAYRAVQTSGGWGRQGGGASGHGELVIVPPIPPQASLLTLRMDRLALDPLEARFPGARPLLLDEPIEIVVGLDTVVASPGVKDGH